MLRVGNVGAGERAVAQLCGGVVAGGQRDDLERVAGLVLHGLRQHHVPRGCADHSHLQMVRLGLMERTKVGQCHAETHQQWGQQMSGDMP